ncbi:hypothetical protein [Deinococcus aestuarii]|uniref:hypothetical protein n=1 Tax=Deinococcus aestuarii TaxID=2774531 RepID=UPI001C0CE6D5|nr:hypothetical protein [Deinococcus aestuarii]
MKQMLVAGALILGLVACGGNKVGGGGGSTTYPYNPDASATESTDTRTPYRGDWVWTAKLPDGSYTSGVLVISERGQSAAAAKNGGAGQNAPCADAGCTSINVNAFDFGLIYSQVASSGPQLVALLGDPASEANRVEMIDTDGKVSTNAQGRAVLSGAGKAGTQAARVAFVQINSDANVGGRIDAVVTPELLAEVKAAADAVAAQSLQALPSSLDGKSMLK